jgi:hypothetical protein
MLCCVVHRDPQDTPSEASEGEEEDEDDDVWVSAPTQRGGGKQKKRRGKGKGRAKGKASRPRKLAALEGAQGGEEVVGGRARCSAVVDIVTHWISALESYKLSFAAFVTDVHPTLLPCARCAGKAAAERQSRFLGGWRCLYGGQAHMHAYSQST